MSENESRKLFFSNLGSFTAYLTSKHTRVVLLCGFTLPPVNSLKNKGEIYGCSWGERRMCRTEGHGDS